MRPPSWIREALDGYRWLWRAHARWRQGPRWLAAVEFALRVAGDAGLAALAALEACASPGIEPVPAAVTPEGRSIMSIPYDSANERLKAGFDSWLWTSMILAVLVHFSTFALWPEMAVAVDTFERSKDTEIIVPPDIEIPEAPEELDKPALPILSPVDLPDDATIGSTSWIDHPPSELPPPPTTIGREVERASDITPFTLEPRVLNPEEVVRALRREYPSVLRDAGIGDTVRVIFSIDETGRVLGTTVERGSEYQALNRAALAVADVIRFSPAMNRDLAVAVRVVFPIVFAVTDR